MSAASTFGSATFTKTAGDGDCSSVFDLPFASCSLQVTGACEGRLECKYKDPLPTSQGSLDLSGSFNVRGTSLSGTNFTGAVVSEQGKPLSCTYSVHATVK